ncbi:MAG TPA: toxin-antitoxin system HicB family antitoxin [Solirubrobacteraceae bacterium]|nr:toxin-antitoxin system HicB family antitoxin [Solirubrobacteraceae bacterium]
MSILADDAIRHYLNLPYRIALTRDGLDEERPWRAAVEELAGCAARGTTAADAAGRIPAAVADWVADAHAAGREVPEPRGARDYSGKLLLRMSKTLHAELAQAAERDEVSLNAYINLLLATAISPPALNGAAHAPEPSSADRGAEPVRPEATVRLQRFLAIALAANVAVVAVAATIAVILLVTAS